MKLSIAVAKPFLVGLILLLLILSAAPHVSAQNEVAIGSVTTKSNAILWLNGNGSQGLILPVVTGKGAVSNPDKGMIVYDDSDNKVWYRTASAWLEVGGGSGGSVANLNLLVQGNQLQLRDGTTVLNSVALASGAQANGSFMVFQGGAWQYATLSGDVTGLNSALVVGGIKGKTIANLPASTQVLAYDPSANSGNGGWIFQPAAAGGGVTNVTGTAPVLVANGTTTPAISLANGGVTNVLLANSAVTSAKIQDATITGTDMADGSVSGGTGGIIADASITNADIAAAAGIAVTKLANGTNGQVLTTVGGVPAWQAPVTSTDAQDLTLSGTTLSLTNDATAVTLGGLSILNSVSSAEITNSTITNVDVSNTAAIAVTKLANGIDGTVLTSVGGVPTWQAQAASTDAQDLTLSGTTLSLTNDATPVALGGLSILNSVTTAEITNATIINADIASAAGIAVSKLANGTNGQVLTTVAGVPTWSAASSGTVTSVGAGTGLTGGPITTTGTLAVDVGTTANKIVQLDGTGKLPAIDGSQLTNLPISTVADGSITGGAAGAGVKIAATTITDANISTTANIAATKLASTVVLDTEAPNAAGDISGDFSTGFQIKASTIVNADVSATAAIVGSKITPNFGAQNVATTGTATAGGGLAAGATSQFTVNGTGNLTKINNVVTSFPAAQGAAGTVLTNDGAGTLSWAPTTSKSKFLITDPSSIDTALTARTYSNQLHAYAISGIQSGTGDAAGFFLIDNPANSFPVVYGETRGSGGVGVMGVANSTSGQGGTFHNFNASNPDPVVTIVNQGTGNALEVDAPIKIADGTQAAGRVLTSDANGLASWQAAGAGSGWSLLGNSGTVDGNLFISPATGDFIGTSDDVPLNFRINNIESGRISNDDQGGTYFGFRAGERETLTGTNPNPRYNTGFGNKAIWKNLTGQNNSALGQGALAENLASNNTAMGQGSLSNNTTGNNNTGYGALTLIGNTTGSNNTAIGEAADVTAANLTNATAIGYQATVNASNKVRIGNGSVTVIEGAVSYTFPSDIRLKKDVRNIDEGLEFINNLRPVSFRMRNGDSRMNWGFIAQEVEALVGTENALLTVGGDEARTLGLRYSDFVAPIVKSVQELNAKVEDLEAENQKLKAALLEAVNEKEKLASENKDLESRMNTIQGDVDEIKRVLNISASKN